MSLLVCHAGSYFISDFFKQAIQFGLLALKMSDAKKKKVHESNFQLKTKLDILSLVYFLRLPIRYTFLVFSY